MFMLTLYDVNKNVVDTWIENVQIRIVARQRENEKIFSLKKIKHVNIGNMSCTEYENGYLVEIKKI